jgi:hypothetical protein
MGDHQHHHLETTLRWAGTMAPEVIEVAMELLLLHQGKL